jgi:hypothetical protein
MAIVTYICTSSTEHLILVGSQCRILRDDAVRPYTDLAPTLCDDACPAFLPRGFLGGRSHVSLITAVAIQASAEPVQMQ